MAIKIKRLLIQNFKLFVDFSVEFDSSNLVVFDGPNGFGKTSFYDALELFFTGRLRRYNDLANKIVDKRQTVSGSPFLNYLSNAGDLIIKGELEVDGNAVCLIRHGNRHDLKRTSRMDKPELKLYLLSKFESTELIPIENEKDFLSSLLGRDYIQNFEFLNYIEQEENTYLLKCKDKERKEAIGHLFNTSEFEQLISKQTEAAKLVGTLCGSSAKAELDSMSDRLKAYRLKLTNEEIPIQYTKIITWKGIIWDAEKLNFPDNQYVEWLGEDGEIRKIEILLESIDEFRKAKANNRLDKLLTNKALIEQLLSYWNFIDRQDEYVNKLSLKLSIDELLNSYDLGTLPAIVQGKIAITQQIQSVIKQVVDFVAYDAVIIAIQRMQKNSDLLSQLLMDVISSRKVFIDKFMHYESTVGQGNSCPLCGYSWLDAAKMKANFDAQESQLEQLVSASGAELSQAIETFNKKFIDKIRSALIEYLCKEKLDIAFVDQLNAAVNNKSSLAAIHQEIVANEIDISTLLNNVPSVSAISKFEEVQIRVNQKKHVINSELLQPYFESLFLKIFDDNFDNAAMVDNSILAAKRKYIEWQYSMHQSSVVNSMQKECDRLTKQYANAKLLKDKILDLKQQYELSLKEYQQSIIKNIEILFHIYSGRISQDYQGGLGLFIDTDKNGIRFLENPSKPHDAVFTMSSGQLAALIISFTLALNKRYSKNKLIFIDDPVQTLDEINIAGLIELLRHEFSEHQIFMSTHEDMMSAYMRYKFQKFGLQAERLSFKEKQLAI